MIVVLLLVGVSAGAVYWKRLADAPEQHFQEGVEAYQLRSFGNAAISWQEAERLGHLEAAGRLGELYLEGRGVARNHKRAFELFERAAREGFPQAQLQLARLYESGRGIEPDLEQAVVWFWTAAKNEEPEAQLELGRMYAEGRGVDLDLAEAARWYQLAAEAGLGEAQLSLALLYHQGRGVGMDSEKAAHWFTRAAEDADLPAAWYYLGRYQEQGKGGLLVDVTQAAWCYDKAAQAKHHDAMYRLGQMAMVGKGVDRDPYRATGFFRELAKYDHPDAQYRLAQAFEHGEGALRSERDAKKWYGEAAAQGHVEAMAALQDLGVDRRELSRYEKRRLAKKREKDRKHRESEEARMNLTPGMCELHIGGGPMVEMRTRMDCLNRGGNFKPSDGASQGSFVTVDTEQDWNRQRRDLRRRKYEQTRQEVRSARRNSDDGGEESTDWVACYKRGSRDSSGRAHYSCSRPSRKTQETTTSWCREQGYQSRRFFKHESSARSWISENCW
jgi:TPR repeat protein